jgi:hypothetical protein
LTGGTIDENLVRSLSARYGELDGEISYSYATHFADVGKTLTSEQRQEMAALRNLDGFVCDGAYLYSQPISMPQNIPSDFLFGVGTYDSSQLSAWIQGLSKTTTVPGTGPVKPGQGAGDSPLTGNGTNQRNGPGIKPAQDLPKPGQGERNTTGQGPVPIPGTGNGMKSATGTGQGPASRIPVEDIISQLEQKGYDVSGAKTLLQSGDREAVKTWLDTFKKDHPGVVEAIEGTGIPVTQGSKTGPAAPSPGVQARGQSQVPAKSIFSTMKNWFFHG